MLGYEEERGLLVQSNVETPLGRGAEWRAASPQQTEFGTTAIQDSVIHANWCFHWLTKTTTPDTGSY